MMYFSDENLMAFADGELDAPTSALIKAAMKTDATIAQRVEHHRAMRDDVYASFAAVLNEPVPVRLRDAILKSGAVAEPTVAAKPMSVIDLGAALTARTAARQGMWQVRGWGALAATLVVGVLIGALALSMLESGVGKSESGGTLASIDGRMAATGKLARALSQQLASAPHQGQPVSIGITFRSTEGEFCRSFTLYESSKHVTALAGLACLKTAPHDLWLIPVLVETAPERTASTGYRMAGSASPAILQAIDERIAGQPLDTAAERLALLRNWRP